MKARLSGDFGDSGPIAVVGKGGVAHMNVDEEGGAVHVYGKGSDTTRVAIDINEYDTGAVSTWDKNGFRQ